MWFEFVAGIADSRRRGYLWATRLCELFLAVNYVSIARMDITPPWAALPRNPWFVFTQLPNAARRGRVLIDRLRAELPALCLTGLIALLNLVRRPAADSPRPPSRRARRTGPHRAPAG
jgi:hypothetical protein